MIKREPTRSTNNNNKKFNSEITPREMSKEKFSGLNVAYANKQLNKYRKSRFTRTQNLLTGETVLTEKEIEVIYYFLFYSLFLVIVVSNCCNGVSPINRSLSIA